MADSPPVTRKRGKQNDGERTSARDRRYGYNDWRDTVESERVLVDKRKKLLRAIPTSIPGVTGILKGQAKRDLREMGALVDMKLQQVLDAEEVAPGGVMLTPRPLIPKANQLEAKQARLARWEKDPSLIEKDMADRREAVSRAEEKDLRMKAQHEAWERGYLSLRAHLMARRRPTASWSRTVEATSSSNTSAPAGGASASSGSPVPVAGETEAALEEGDGRASAVGGGEGRPDGGNMKGNGNGGNTAAIAGSSSRRREGEGEALGGSDASGAGVAVWSCEGEEEEEEASLRELERVVMDRAGLEGEFDMAKVIDVLTDRSRQVMSARRELASLLAQQQQHDQKQKYNGNDEMKRDLDKAHPGDMALLGRWHELLRSTDLVGEGRRPPNGMDDAYHEACDSDETLLCKKSATLLIPRGLDLVPSMRAPRYPTLVQQLVQHQQQQQERQHERQEEEEATSAKETSRNRSNAIEMEVEGRKSGAASTVAARVARVMECVPWIGIEGGGSAAGVQGVPTVVEAVDARRQDPESAQTIAGVMSSIGDRVQWFPRGLPMEMAQSEGGYDERQSAHYVSKTSQALDRLKNLMKETAKRQEEMELRRRLKAKETLGLVRAVADHEKLRQEHLKRMKSLRKQLEKLETAKRSSLSSDAEEPACVGGDGDPEASDSEISSTTRAADEGDRGNDSASPKAASTSATDAVSPTARAAATASAAGAAGATSASPLGVTVATTRSRSPPSPRALMAMATPTSPPGKKGKGRGKGRDADAKSGESPSGHQQLQQAVRGSRKGEEEVASATSSTSPTSPPSSSSPCPSPSPGLEKTAGVVVVAARVGSDEALSKDDGSRVVESGGEGGGVREGDDGDDDKGYNSASDSKDPPVEDSFEAVASDSRKRALGGEAGSGVVARGPSKRRRSADVVMAMSVNDDSGTGRNASVVNGETSGASLLPIRHAGVQVSPAAGSKIKGNDTIMTPLSSGGGKSKPKAAISGRRASSTRQGSRGRWGGRR